MDKDHTSSTGEEKAEKRNKEVCWGYIEMLHRGQNTMETGSTAKSPLQRSKHHEKTLRPNIVVETALKKDEGLDPV